MADSSLNFSSIVATPTLYSWAQAYNAGKLFAALSVQKDKTEEGIPEGEHDGLATLGKDLLTTFEQEFFTLETKDLTSIKDAILKTTAKVPTEIKLSFSCAFLADSVLYLFVASAGKIYLKRESKIGAIIDFSENKSDTVKSASGYLQTGDTLILETDAFSKVIPLQSLADSLDHQSPSEIAEILAPLVHEKGDEGAAAAMIISFKEEAAVASSLIEDTEEQNTPGESINDTPSTDPKEEIALASEEKEEEPKLPVIGKEEIDDDMSEGSYKESLNFGPSVRDDIRGGGRESFIKRLSAVGGILGRRRLRSSRIGGSRRTLLIVGAVIMLVLIFSSVFAINQRNSSQKKALFNKVYAQAQTKYDEGRNLVDLNRDLANESLKESQKILTENKDKFGKDSDEQKKILALLANVNKELGGASTSTSSGAKTVPNSESPYLANQIDNNSSHFAQDPSFVYYVGSSGVIRIDKGNDKETTIIEKDFGTVGGTGVYLANVYVLEKGSSSILKFTESDGDFTEGTYLAEDQKADFSKAVAMAIDGSLYVLFSDGSINKYLRGSEQAFAITGLKKALSGPSKIFTSRDIEKIYILDKGNSRIVVIDKEGKFLEEYSSSVIKNAKDFEVLEADKKILVLSGGKIYQITLK